MVVQLSTFSGELLKETYTERAVDNKAKSDVILSTWTEILSTVLSKLPDTIDETYLKKHLAKDEPWWG